MSRPGTEPIPHIGDVMMIVSPAVAEVLGALDVLPRTQKWLDKEVEANRSRMERLRDVGLVRTDKSWFGLLTLWSLTEKGGMYLRAWSEEMELRRLATGKGPYLDRELDQIPDNATFRVFETKVTGMTSALIQVPHDPVARDLPWEPPEDMVIALGLMSEEEVVSIQYLVGGNTATEGTTAGRMAEILPILEGMGLANRKEHGWLRTPRGSRMHDLWIMTKKEPTT